MSKSLFTIFPLVLFVIGLFILFNSVPWGSEGANAYLRAQGGGMDGAQFMIVFQEYINMYRWIGIVLSVIGGLSLMRTVELR